MMLASGSLLLAAWAARRPARAAETARETRAVSGFHEVVFSAAGELYVNQAEPESLTIEAEPAVLRKITSSVSAGRLTLGFAPGNVVARELIRFRLQVRDLRAFELQSSADVHIGPLETDRLALALPGSGDIRLDRLAAQRLELRIGGSGTVTVQGGRVDEERIELAGSGTVDTVGLSSRDAQVVIDGSGDVRLAAADRLAVRIGGAGSVRYRGNPEVTQTITGAGVVERD